MDMATIAGKYLRKQGKLDDMEITDEINACSVEITVDVDGMQCGMCENHVNEAVRGAFPVKKVSSSHSKKQTVIITEQDIDEQELKAVIDGTGYESGAVKKEPYEKKGLFGFLK